MKKMLLVVVFAIFGLSASNAQGVLNGGVNVGLPVGDSDTGYSFVLGAEVNYMFTVSDGFTAGPSIAFSNFFGKTVNGFKVPSASFLPISLAGRFNVSDKFVAGADLGYAIGISPSGNDGGFYYRPIVGYKIGDDSQLNISYSGVSVNGGTFSNIGLGVMFGL